MTCYNLPKRLGNLRHQHGICDRLGVFIRQRFADNDRKQNKKDKANLNHQILRAFSAARSKQKRQKQG